MKTAKKVMLLILLAAMTASIVLAGCNKETPAPERNSPESSAGFQSPNIEQTQDKQNEDQDSDDKEQNNSQNQEQSQNDQNGKQSNSRKAPVKVKGLYISGWVAGVDSKMQHFIELANTTEINAFVIDVKDVDGIVAYKSDIPKVKEIGAWESRYNPEKVISQLHENNIHVIARITCFNDSVASSKIPELAIKHVNGGLWKEKKSESRYLTWLNPYKKEAWDYIIDIAKEAVAKGFDEIQFDYIRFPTGIDVDKMDFSGETKERYEIINEFLAYAKEQIPDVPISADVFGIVCESPKDTENIGQYLELIIEDIDYISPMIYPSLYAFGQVVNGIAFQKPDLEPYNVVYNALLKTKDRLSKVEGADVIVRPYLQDFTASWLGSGNYQVYGAEQVKQQIKAVKDAGYEEWILWDPDSTYSEGALEKIN